MKTAITDLVSELAEEEATGGAALAVGALQQRVGAACDPLYSDNGFGLIFFWLPDCRLGPLVVTGIAYAALIRGTSRLAYAAPAITLIIAVLIVWAMDVKVSPTAIDIGRRAISR